MFALPPSFPDAAVAFESVGSIAVGGYVTFGVNVAVIVAVC